MTGAHNTIVWHYFFFFFFLHIPLPLSIFLLLTINSSHLIFFLLKKGLTFPAVTHPTQTIVIPPLLLVCGWEEFFFSRGGGGLLSYFLGYQERNALRSGCHSALYTIYHAVRIDCNVVPHAKRRQRKKQNKKKGGWERGWIKRNDFRQIEERNFIISSELNRPI